MYSGSSSSVWFCLRWQDAACTYNSFYIPRPFLCGWPDPRIEQFYTCCVTRHDLNLMTLVVLTRPSPVLTRPSLLPGWTPLLGWAGPGATLGGDYWGTTLRKYQLKVLVSQLQCLLPFSMSTWILICSMRSPGSWLGQWTLDNGCAGDSCLVLDPAWSLAFCQNTCASFEHLVFSTFSISLCFVNSSGSFLFSLDDCFCRMIRISSCAVTCIVFTCITSTLLALVSSLVLFCYL